MKIVISGGREIGFLLARQYSSDNDVIVIETDQGSISELEKLDLQVVRGNPTSLSTLQAAEVEEAHAFIACAHSDEVNVISCLAVKQLSKARTFCFVNKIHYFETFAGDLGEQLVIDSLIWPEMLLGEYIGEIIAVPEAIDVRMFAQENLKLLEYRLKEGDRHIGRTLREFALPKGALAVAIFRDEEVIIPGGSTEFKAHDKVIFMGHKESLKKLEAHFSQGSKKQANVIIVGGGNVGFILAATLSQNSGCKIRLIEKSRERCMFLAENLPESVLLMNADGTDVNVLKTQQVNNADCFVAITGSDEKNLMVALRARQMGVKRVITRAHSIDNIDFFESLGIDIALSSQLNAIQTVHR
ncbi:MAG: Trk system potassium transporter TrkA, partial [Candidatus Rifleibacteriota bacterium]